MLHSPAAGALPVSRDPLARRVQAGDFMTSPLPSAATDQTPVSRNRLILIVHTAAIFTSALLLFSVQPLFTKMVLPRLGGSPAGWSVAMVFFQSLLLRGYAHAPFFMQIRTPWIPLAGHLVLLGGPFPTPPPSIPSPPAQPPHLRPTLSPFLPS